MWKSIKPLTQKSSLANKLTLVMSGLAVGVALIVSGSALLRERSNFHKELEQQATLILDALSVATSDALYFDQFDEASELINNLDNGFQEQHFLVAAQLYQTDGRLLADTLLDSHQVLSLRPHSFGSKIITSKQLVLEWHHDYLTAGRPVVVGDEIVGALSIRLSTQPLQRKLRKTLVEGLIAALVAVISSIIFARLISRSIANPLQQLTTTTMQISGGQWGKTVALQTNDEMMTLANAFNHMSGQLHKVVESFKLQANELKQSRQIAQAKADELEQALQELYKTQEQLIQQEKMSSLGQMVAGIAHEINNPVTFIQGNVEPAQAYMDDLLQLIELYQRHYPHPHREILDKQAAIELPFLKQDIFKLLSSMSVGAERITTIVNSLRIFSRLDKALCKPVDLHVCIDSTLVILEHRLKGNGHRPAIEVIKDYGKLSLIECFAGQLNQVFMNLLTNAIDAFEEHYASLTSESDKNFQQQIHIHTRAITDHRVVIKISDNAGGMSEQVNSKIFDPFYTTKPVGKGTGLGLAISYQIITDLHGGKLTCRSVPGQGTDFFIDIPSSQSSVHTS